MRCPACGQLTKERLIFNLSSAAIDGKSIPLGPKEMMLLKALKRNQGYFTHVKTLGDLIDCSASAVGVHIFKLRRKLEGTAAYIDAAWADGYELKWLAEK